ncbi:MAG: MATE family efflux transporter [Desulfurococcales archaeon]|nr:MATE family efflux transporter [Desulfurococcales archaeon]
MQRGLAERRKRILGDPRVTLLIVELSLPLFVSGSLQSLYSIIDTFWLSRLGSAALGTPTVSWPYRGVLMSLGFGLASSLSALAGQYIGAGDYRRASRNVGQVLGLLLAVGVPGTIAFYAARHLYIDATRMPEDVAALAEGYIAVTLAGVPFTYVFLVFNFALGAAGDTRTPMKVSVATTLLNFALDPLMIFTLHMGVVGAAAATLASNVVAGSYAAYSLLTGAHGLRVRPGDLLPEGRTLKLIARVGGPTTAQRLLTTVGFVVMMRIVGGLGTPVVAAYSIGQVMLSIDHIIVFPLVRSTSIIIAQSLGAGLLDRAKRALQAGLRLVVALVGLYVAALVAARDHFIGVFTGDPQVYSAASRMILIFAPSVLGFDLTILADSTARSSGHTLLVSLLGAARLWLLRIPLSYTLAYRLGLGDTGLWLGMAASNWATGAAALAWLLSYRWLRPIVEPAAPRRAGTV